MSWYLFVAPGLLAGHRQGELAHELELRGEGRPLLLRCAELEAVVVEAHLRFYNSIQQPAILVKFHL